VRHRNVAFPILIVVVASASSWWTFCFDDHKWQWRESITTNAVIIYLWYRKRLSALALTLVESRRLA
jgi:hypothetical protein